ncbi:hypothetical protein H70357_10795 [Paenibacillus sp. FSL H7-0357]|jgi:hypothetical protein|uniref:hypothetical protein n=1 Tax=unclassified Paenibacillus TaxID=185978 RepID=UPI0004F6F44F|nr:hypothetical protein [Paenibacillus sp. FSL H7-0357]AIQ17091.1 hypothetical protein H70357_10795 [Paenibacillus sp. FSL H7-0357]
MLLLLFLVIAAVCIAVDVPLLKQGSRTRDLLVWGVLWIMGLGATVCFLYRIKVPSPLLLVMLIYRPVNSLFESWFY